MKKYTIFSLIFISILVLLIYIQSNSYTSFHFGDFNISLPNAVWIAIFMGTYFIFSLIFITFINLKNVVFQKNVNKDIQAVINNLKTKILYKNETKNTKILNSINSFVIQNVNGLEITPKKLEKFEFLEDINKLKNGEVINISKYKLNQENPWFILNIKNRLKKEPSYAREVLKKFKNEELRKEAFYIYAKSAPIYEIVKYEYPINLEIILSHIEEKELSKLLEKAKLTPKEEIEVARKIYQTKNPDEELNIIKPLTWGYAYLALKYEHLELAKEIIETNNLKFFEFFLLIRENGLKASIDEYIDSTI